MKRVLVAEDSYALANLLRFVLLNAGFDVDLHRTGASALEAGKASKFDLIMLDQQMPRMTGLDVIEELRREGLNATTPIFLCTAKTHELQLDDITNRLAVARIIHKPFSPKELVDLAKTATEQTQVV